ncbi:MAG: holo-ACP synthase [Peptostreptococcaceae bacterium]|nr:holo-ACP synthase [Peptostreptococcaceae bacterium]
MIIGIGTDIIEIGRIKKAIMENGRFLSRVFTENEIRYATSKNGIRYSSIAGMWAAKEAYAKATGKGFRDFAMKDVEVLHDDLSSPGLRLYRKARIYSEGAKVHISISHSDLLAIAYCIIERKG